jgi:hypothetical protein
MGDGYAPRKRRRRKRPVGAQLVPLDVDDATTEELFTGTGPVARTPRGAQEFVIDLPVIEGAEKPLPSRPDLPHRRPLSRR